MTTASEPLLYMPAWNDVQIKRFMFRSALFVRRGLPHDDAERLGDRLATRDYQRDDRRACAECSNLQRGNTCFKKHPVLTTQLMRCDGFQFQTP